MQGPIFNNFDVAGYLVYSFIQGSGFLLTTGQKLIRRLFLLMSIFRCSLTRRNGAISRDYRFNVIVFNYRERSVRGEQFIIRRVLDPMWATVYLDKDIIILAKRDGPNQPVIAKYELPKEGIDAGPTDPEVSSRTGVQVFGCLDLIGSAYYGLFGEPAIMLGI